MSLGSIVFSSLSYDASTTTMYNVLREKGSCGSNYAVTRTSVRSNSSNPSSPVIGYAWAVTFNCPAPVGGWPLLSVQSVSLTGSVAFNVQRTTTASEPISGTYRLQFRSEWTAPITVGISNDALLKIMAGHPDFRIEYGCSSAYVGDGFTCNFRFFNPMNVTAPFDVDSSLLLGYNVSLTSFVKMSGSADDILLDPVPGDLLETAVSYKPVEVTVNGLKAACVPSGRPQKSINRSQAEFMAWEASFCGYEYSIVRTPVVFSLSSTNITQGDSIVIRGTLFAANVTGNSVDLRLRSPLNISEISATVPCNVTYGTADEIRCTVGNGAEGLYEMVVTVAGAGVAYLDPTVPGIYFNARLDSISPLSLQGSLIGGNILTVRGAGFALFPSVSGVSHTLLIGNLACSVLKFSSTLFTCTVPALTDAENILVNSGVGSVAQNVSIVLQRSSSVDGFVTRAYSHPYPYLYTSALTPLISSVVPAVVSVAISTTLTISGQGFTSLRALATSVDRTISQLNATDYLALSVMGKKCELLSANDTQLTCKLLRSAPPACNASSFAAPALLVDGVGSAYASSTTRVDLALRITSLSPSQVSLAGGARLTVLGEGFHPTYTYAEISGGRASNLHCSVKLLVDTRGVDATGVTWNTTAASNDFLSLLCDIVFESSNRLECITRAAGLSPTKAYAAQVQVTVNSIVTAAPFDWPASALRISDQTPVIISSSPASGITGTLLSLSGVRLGNPVVNITVGDGLCIPSYQDSTTINCTTTAATAGTVKVRVYFAMGEALNLPSSISFQHITAVDSTFPSAGSLAGGTVLTIRGHGFSDVLAENLVAVGDFPATVVYSTHNTLVVVTAVYGLAYYNAAFQPASVAPISVSVLNQVDVNPVYMNMVDIKTQLLSPPEPVVATMSRTVTSSTMRCTATTNYDCAAPGSTYIGCMLDSSTRDLPVHIGNRMSVETCRNYAINRNYTYFGLQYGGEFCLFVLSVFYH
jgi:hypothetical protein